MPHYTNTAGVLGRSIHDCPSDAQDRAEVAKDETITHHETRWRRWIADECVEDLRCDLPECGDEAWVAVHALLRRALAEPWSSEARKDAEAIVTALACRDADREMEG